MEYTKNLLNCLKCHHRNPENAAVPAAYCPLIPEMLARCTRLEEARERANEACAKWEARAEQAEKERDAAISDLETAMAHGIESNCLLCKNDQCYVRGGGKPCLPKWRGIQGE